MIQEELGSLASFQGNPLFSDVTLVSSTSTNRIPAHRIILAAGSRYLFKWFGDNADGDIKDCTIPNPEPTLHKIVENPLEIVLRYLYHSQGFGSVENLLKLDNVFNVYSQAFALQTPKLLEELEEWIVTKLVNKDTAVFGFIEGIRFDNKRVKEEAETILVNKLEEIATSDLFKGAVVNIPFEEFKEFCKKDALNIKYEKVVLELIKDYIAKRDSLPVDEGKEEERERGPEMGMESMVSNVENRENEQKQPIENVPESEVKAAEEPKPTEEQNEEAKQEAKVEEAKNEEKPSEYIENLEIKKEANLKEPSQEDKRFANKLKLHKLTDEQKLALLRCIRYSYLEHEELLTIVSDPTFSLAKDLVLQGLSIRLNQYEALPKDRNWDIELKPRNHFIEQKRYSASGYLVPGPSKSKEIDPGKEKLPDVEKAEGLPQQLVVESEDKLAASDMLSSDIRNEPEELPKDERLKKDKSLADKSIKEDLINLKTLKGEPMVNSIMKMDAINEKTLKERSMDRKESKEDPRSETLSNKFYDVYPPANVAFTQTMQPGTKPKIAENMLYKSMKGGLEGASLGPRPPQKSFYNPVASTKMSAMLLKEGKAAAAEFSYISDFDENGLLYFLGTTGKTTAWRNPQTIGQVTVFSSSLGHGSLEDIVGRVATNCRTLNEPFSFFGIDIGVNRSFRVSCYTLCNRNISSHTMLAWQFEGSNDKEDWKMLDRRVYLTEDFTVNAEMESVRSSLMKKGATTTWQIEADKAKDSYRYFRVVQIGKNSSGSDNMSLSGIELYGKLFY